MRLIVYFIISTGAAGGGNKKCEVAARGAARVALLFCAVKWILPETQWPTAGACHSKRMLRDVIAARKQFSPVVPGGPSLLLFATSRSPLSVRVYDWTRLLFFLGHAIYSRGREKSPHGRGVTGDIKLFLFFCFPLTPIACDEALSTWCWQGRTQHRSHMQNGYAVAFTLFISHTYTPPGCLPSVCCEGRDEKKIW